MAILLGSAGNVAEPSREDLLRELLTPNPTGRSAHFETLEPDKLDLLRSLPAYATEQGLKLRALLMIGPNGPGRAHTVVVVLAQEEATTVRSSPPTWERRASDTVTRTTQIAWT